MRDNPHHAVTDEAAVRALIAAHPWTTIVSTTSRGLVASHYPVMLDMSTDALVVVTHVGRPDDEVHELGDREVLLVFAGPHGYISPSWYAPGAVRAPTWNFSVVHAHGVPEIMSAEENQRTLTRLVAHFEQHVDHPVWLEPETADRLAPGTVGLRIPITRWEAKFKLSQDKDPESRARVVAELRGGGPYANPALADAVERAGQASSAAATGGTP